MMFSETPLEGVYVIELEPIEDERGFFARSWCAEEFGDHGLNANFVQCNIAFSKNKGTIRGLHFQAPPHEEIKLIRCTKGKILDVVVDLRRGSQTFMNWHGVELTPENHKMLYVPKGIAHGYQTLENESEVFYPVSEFYHPGVERGLRWNDPAFGIEWRQTDSIIVSEKDKCWPYYVS